MLYPGRLPGEDAEHAAVDKLLAEHPGEQGSITREGETMIVQIADDIWEIAQDGTTKKQRKS